MVYVCAHKHPREACAPRSTHIYSAHVYMYVHVYLSMHVPQATPLSLILPRTSSLLTH